MQLYSQSIENQPRLTLIMTKFLPIFLWPTPVRSVIGLIRSGFHIFLGPIGHFGLGNFKPEPILNRSVQGFGRFSGFDQERETDLDRLESIHTYTYIYTQSHRHTQIYSSTHAHWHTHICSYTNIYKSREGRERPTNLTSDDDGVGQWWRCRSD